MIALRKLLEDLGAEADVTGPVVEIGGVILTAHAPGKDRLDPSFLNKDNLDPLHINPETFWKWVSIRAHVVCPVCKEMRHSGALKETTIRGKQMHGGYAGLMSMGPPMLPVSVAAQLGRWLAAPHECEASGTRRIGFRDGKDPQTDG